MACQKVCEQGRENAWKQRSRIGKLEQKLAAALVKEKDKILEEFPGFRMLGENFILSDAAIEQLVLKAPFVVCTQDLNDILLLRSEYRDRFFNVIWDILLTAPPPNKKRRKW